MDGGWCNDVPANNKNGDISMAIVGNCLINLRCCDKVLPRLSLRWLLSRDMDPPHFQSCFHTPGATDRLQDAASAVTSPHSLIATTTGQATLSAIIFCRVSAISKEKTQLIYEVDKQILLCSSATHRRGAG